MTVCLIVGPYSRAKTVIFLIFIVRDRFRFIYVDDLTRLDRVQLVVSEYITRPCTSGESHGQIYRECL